MLNCVITYIPPKKISHWPFPKINAMFEIHSDVCCYYWDKTEFGSLMKIANDPANKIFLFHIKNVGFGPALSTELQSICPRSFSFGTLSAGDEFNLIVILHEPFSENLVSHFTFTDILGWKYQQTHTFDFKTEKVVQ